MRTLSVRNVDPELAAALDEERRKSGASLNQTVLDLLRRALGLRRDAPYSNGLAELAGDWSDAEHEAFERACQDFEKIDEDLWK